MVPMYYAFYVTGLWLTGQGDQSGGYAAFEDLLAGGEEPWLTRVSTLMAAVGVPLLIGSVPYATLGAVASYRWAKAIVSRRRDRRNRARLSALGRSTGIYETFVTSTSVRLRHVRSQ